jgi:hypothetical protein
MNDDSTLDCSDIPRSCCGQTEEFCECTPEKLESQTTEVQQLKAEISRLKKRALSHDDQGRKIQQHTTHASQN